MNKKIGIIDLGSNSVRLVIFEVSATGGYRLVDDISDTLRLSENMLDDKFLNDIAMHKTIKTIKLFKKLCVASNITPKNIIGVATAAVRKAENRDQFLKLLHNSTGLNFKLISGEEEALYVYQAAIYSIDIDDGIIIDIGGGSTEIIKFREKNILNYVSIPIGAVVATEKFLDKDKISSEKLQKFEEHIESMLLDLGWLSKDSNEVIIGLGGTIRNLSKIQRKSQKYPLDITHNYRMDISDFNNIYDKLKGLDLDSRKKVEGLSSRRADIIVGGLAIFKTISKITSSKKLVISGYGLREGVLLEQVFQSNPAKKFMDVLTLSLENYMEFYCVRRDHSEHVSKTALSLFDQLRPLHLMGSEDRKLLRVSSLLHDIGITVGYYNHHLHSYYMILNSRLNGLSHREIVLSAAIVASHSKEKFKDDWAKAYKNILKPSDMDTYSKLSLLLKIVECLDRSETGVIKAVECHINSTTVKIKAIRDDDADLELSQALENADLFKKLFNRNLVIV